MRLDEFDYALPESQIARVPASPRDASRMLVFERASGEAADELTRDLPRHVRPGDVVVLNDVRVSRARLRSRRESGASVELLVVRRESDAITCLANGRGRLRVGERLRIEGAEGVSILLEGRAGEGWRARVEGAEPGDLLDRLGEVPVPPYIRKARRDDHLDPASFGALDRERYQTVYAAGGEAVAAPTAGLHLTEEVLARIEAAGAAVARIRLEVGPGTFAPVRVENVEEHRMDSERYSISEEASAAIEGARAHGGRVLAVGTTVVRALESAARDGGRVAAAAGETELFIRPGFEFRVVGALLTNFHLPRSTLLMLVCAFAGRDATLGLYASAVERGYRFYSYGDAMLIL